MLVETILRYYNERKGKFIQVTKQGGEVNIAYRIRIDASTNEEIADKEVVSFPDYQQGIEKLLSEGSCSLPPNQSRLEIHKDDSKGVYLNIQGASGTIMGVHLSISPERFMYKGGKK